MKKLKPKRGESRRHFQRRLRQRIFDLEQKIEMEDSVYQKSSLRTAEEKACSAMIAKVWEIRRNMLIEVLNGLD